MNKLKTLKDIEKIEKDYEWCYSNELRKEAIKWVKWFYSRAGYWNEARAFKHFFNITEEDLE